LRELPPTIEQSLRPRLQRLPLLAPVVVRELAEWKIVRADTSKSVPSRPKRRYFRRYRGNPHFAK
jgi:hypothetical protein